MTLFAVPSAAIPATRRSLGVSDSTPCSGRGPARSGSVGALAFERAGTAHHLALERIAAALAPYATGRQYLNFTEANTDPARFYRPDVFHRLRAVKAAYDPDDLFSRQPPDPARSLSERSRREARRASVRRARYCCR